MVFIRTSPFRKTTQFSRSVVVPLRSPSSDNCALVGVALMGLTAIYEPGFDCAKAGVMRLDISGASTGQFELALGVGDSAPLGRGPGSWTRLMR